MSRLLKRIWRRRVILGLSNLKPIPGIYKIECRENNRIYIGQSVNVRERVLEHKRNLEKEKHPNRIMQSSFSKYGLPSFEVSVVEIINDREQLTCREAYWADYFKAFDRDIGFNICPIVENQANTYQNIEHSESILGEKNGNSKLNEEKIRGICEMLNERAEGTELYFQEIGNRFGVTYKAIANIEKGRNWGNITKNYLKKQIVEKWKDEYKDKWVALKGSGLELESLGNAILHNIFEDLKCIFIKRAPRLILGVLLFCILLYCFVSVLDAIIKAKAKENKGENC